MDTTKINWQSEENYFFYNPRLSAANVMRLKSAYDHFIKSSQWSHCIFLPSSGTGGKSKIYAIKKSAILYAAQAAVDFAGFKPKTKVICPLPLHHMGALAIYARSSILEQEVINLDKWHADQFMQLAAEANYTSLVPTQIYDLVSCNYIAPPNLEHIIVGGSYLSKELYSRARKLNWPIYPSFGATELCSQIASAKTLQENDYKLELLPHIEAKLLSDQRLTLKSKALFTAYIDVDSLEVSEPELDSESYFLSEDFAKLDGRILTPLGRKSDYIKINAEAVSILRVEENLKEFLSTKFCVLALEDERKGYKLVVCSEDKDITSNINRYNLAASPVERIVAAYHMTELPRNELGKIRTAALKEDILTNKLIALVSF